ncbi:unnamed protein product [Echinostoma caproni]|uniref:Aa_trans domain-containing protein n=1 Tax=Echinostoma caproni TaxID=27848 RepID=A0A183AQU8_9TREM|nr:unnamed protein product [Echinostoma caproni]
MENHTMTTSALHVGTGPALNQALGYGFLAVTVTNMAALTGLLFAPLSKCPGYLTFMSFMVTTAVGSLFSSAILVLIPETILQRCLLDDRYRLIVDTGEYLEYNPGQTFTELVAFNKCLSIEPFHI